ncbi:hypothetical protein [Paenibacillus amylolyticus]|uniref:hypothetical protein n=1 Tax=Paenibacillus amylolyticus TaxID=1451 RepID=UPI000FD98B2F|nr:hypothetical protein [Paenibacillus amylolyticus]
MEETRAQISKEMSDVAFNFLDMMFNANIEGYWNSISKVDKARIFGMYRQYSSEETTEFSFRDYIEQEILPGHTKYFEGLRDNNPGISATLRYTEEGEALLYLFPDVQETRIIEEEREELVYPLTLTIDTEFNNGEVSHIWKVRAYRDKWYENLA